MAGHRPARVGEVMRDSSVSVKEDATPRQVLASMEASGLDELPIVGEGGAYRGMVERRAVERILYDRAEADATAAMVSEAPPLASAAPDDAIEDAVDTMLAADLDVMPVVAPGGQLAGLLVREDLHNVPGLLEVVGEDRKQREVAAEAGPFRVALVCSLAATALGLVLFGFWVQGAPNGLPRWIGWVDASAAALAFIGAVMAFGREYFSVPVWAVAGLGLCFAASIGYAFHDGAWATWVQALFGLAFLGMAAALGSQLPRRRHAAVRATA